MVIREVTSEVIGSVWKIERSVGDAVEEGDLIMILESMKMEIPVEAPVAGTLSEIKVVAEGSVEEDQVLCLIET
ncbi:MAG: acetyl-CoA carboxylase biotin carboxyl carrier protein subunit [Rhodospirillaceae bacterium TMED8]|nr:acetyl-CoA carboxylase biotin carboxyl carrier protein subunit [Magnetovibrio sp.]OUT51561.1 MAG: acetyl-CoA carboxylase biotin carboxyl carrier protein subunit [Rhodospirillaceae bacterium TMED8]|tara:strand:+ start:4266 stop:4487 length:222 start_codon:yes stop_codon:yes gene_type:complete